MTRQAILPLVFAFLLKGFGNLNLIWGAFVLAELCGIPLAAALWKRKGEKDRFSFKYRKEKQKRLFFAKGSLFCIP